MKSEIIKFVLKALLDLIMNLLEDGMHREKEISEMKESFKKDVELAETARRAYPTLSDEAIKKELC